ncbi:MAG: hypothetical protein SPI12_00230 [Actinomycetaceae bacterium]|nr:hypothetical protein [Actinomycetaceae bacterium]MDY6082281.1 hypothetical protein [Actinomycetaceae bacterium]
MLFKRMIPWSAVLVVLLISACGAASSTADQGSSAPISPQTVTVSRSSIAPTVSEDSTVIQAPALALVAPSRGAFQPSIKAGQAVKAGQVLGKIGESSIVSPVDASIVSVSHASGDVPKNYPLISLSYQGFAIEVSSHALLRSQALSSIHGKFQITDAQGPSDCTAVVTPASESMSAQSDGDMQNDSDEAPEQSSGSQHSDSDRLLCLIDKGVDVRSGMHATVVLTGTMKKNVLVLPVNAVAGRAQTGRVVKKDGEDVSEVDVKLGVSDGAHIEIISGLHEGDTVLDAPPNLDPRNK